jgi:predicted dehydrogenase
MVRRDRLRVGVIGANPDTGWAARSHLPAIVATEGIELTAVSTSRMQSALVAAERFGAAHAFDDAAALAACDEVDLVIVAVRVPSHRKLVETALTAGKHVYCEWPLGVDAAETEDLAAAANEAGVRTAIGLQARSAPEVRYLRDLIADGYLGEVLTCSATALSARGADLVPPAKRYLFDAATGANMMTVETGHLLDALCYLLGEPRTLRGVAAVRRRELPDTDGGTITNDTPDVVIALGTTAGDAPVSMHVAQGTHASEATVVTIVGSTGALRLTTRGPGGIQMAPATLLGAPSSAAEFAPLDVPDSYRSVRGLAVPSAVNVAEALRAFATDIREGTETVPGFEHAIVRHRMLELLQGDPLVRAGGVS